MIRSGWGGVGWRGVAWRGEVRCGAVRCSAVRCGMVWYAYGGTVQGMDGMYGIVGHGI